MLNLIFKMLTVRILRIFKIKKTAYIVFMGQFPISEKKHDGAEIRMKSIDKLLNSYFRIYIRNVDGYSVFALLIKIHNNIFEIQINRYSLIHKFQLLVIMIASKNIYCHSVYQFLPVIYYIPFIKLFFDVHGVVTDELILLGKSELVKEYLARENLAFKKARVLIFVTEAMRAHYAQLHNISNKTVITLPILGMQSSDVSADSLIEGKSCYQRPVTVFAGGTQSWQKLPLMREVIENSIDKYSYKIFLHDPSAFSQKLQNGVCCKDVLVKSATWTELQREYLTAHYGFVLRSDNTVNRVACPTKLFEYMSFGLVPVLDFEDIGDFKNMGMRYVKLTDYEAGEIPDWQNFQYILGENLLLVKKIEKLFLSESIRLNNEFVK